MPALIDTDVAVELMRHNPFALDCVANFNEAVFISSITASELYFGAYNSAHPDENAHKAKEFIESFTVLTITSETARIFGRMKAMLRRQSTQVAPFDLMIAAIALENGCAVATGNVRHFRNIGELHLIDWIRGACTGRVQ